MMEPPPKHSRSQLSSARSSSPRSAAVSITVTWNRPASCARVEGEGWVWVFARVLVPLAELGQERLEQQLVADVVLPVRAEEDDSAHGGGSLSGGVCPLWLSSGASGAGAGRQRHSR